MRLAVLSSALLLALSQNALAVNTTFTYQGTLHQAGLPADGPYDLRFTLVEGEDSIGTVFHDDVNVVDGVFTVALDFGQLGNQEYRLEIGVRPGPEEGDYEKLLPPTAVRPGPQAQLAGIAEVAVSVAANSVNSSSIFNGSIAAADVNEAEIQKRVTGNCAAGNSIRAIAADGTVTCEAVGANPILIETADGISGGPITGTGTLSLANDGVTSQKIEDGGVAAVDVNSAEVQLRVNSACPAGSSIRVIQENGTVTCENTAALGAWALAGNASTNPATQFLGTTDNQPLVLRTHNRQALRLEPVSSGGFNFANVVAGHHENSAASIYGATVVGGGSDVAAFGFGQPSGPNQSHAHYGTLVGGYANRIGDSGNPDTSGFAATVLGGVGNHARGQGSLIAGGYLSDTRGLRSAAVGGYFNTAAGDYAIVAGGSANCAGGNYSLAAGRNAKVRPGTGLDVNSCGGVTTSGDFNGDEGSFVWADSSSETAFTTTGPNQFLVRADGGVGFNSTSLSLHTDFAIGAKPNTGDDDVDLLLATRGGKLASIFLADSSGTLHFNPATLTTGSDRLRVFGGTGGTATLSNGGAWNNASSRSFKTDFVPVDGREVLERVTQLPITRWNYIGSGEGTHMGPMAEDFKAAFDLAGEGKSIATVDADGVALAAIQGLNQKLEEENAKLRDESAELRRRLDAVEALLRGH